MDYSTRLYTVDKSCGGSIFVVDVKDNVLSGRIEVSARIPARGDDTDLVCDEGIVDVEPEKSTPSGG